MLVYDAILNKPMIRVPEIATLCDINRNTAANAIRKLKEKNFIEYHGSAKTGGFTIRKNQSTE